MAAVPAVYFDRDRLCTVIGIGKVTAQAIVAEIGVDMGRFPTAAHLPSWAGMCPGNHESAGKRRSGKARKGNAALRSALIEAAWAASHSKNSTTPLQYRRFCRRFGKKSESKAIFVIAHSCSSPSGTCWLTSPTMWTSG